MKTMGILITFSIHFPKIERHLLCMRRCCRCFRRHMAMKVINIRTIPPNTQPTMTYSMSPLRARVMDELELPPPAFRSEADVVLSSRGGNSEAPGLFRAGLNTDIIQGTVTFCFFLHKCRKNNYFIKKYKDLRDVLIGGCGESNNNLIIT